MSDLQASEYDRMHAIFGYDEEDELSKMMMNANYQASFAREDNLTDAIVYINQSLSGFGFPSPLDFSTADTANVLLTVNCIYAVLKNLQLYLDKIEEFEEKVRKLNSDLTLQQNYTTKAKEYSKAKERELDLALNREKKLEDTLKAERKQFAVEKDELNKQLVMLQHRDTQYKHSMKKQEREVTRLQEKLHTLIAERTRQNAASMEMLEVLQRNGNTYSRDRLQSQEDYYRMINDAFHEKMDELQRENEDLRRSMKILQGELQEMLNEASPVKNHSNHRTSSSSYFDLPYDMARGKIEVGLLSKLDLLKQKITRMHKNDRNETQTSAITSDTLKESDNNQEQMAEYLKIIEEQEEIIAFMMNNNNKSNTSSNPRRQSIEALMDMESERAKYESTIQRLEEEIDHLKKTHHAQVLQALGSPAGIGRSVDDFKTPKPIRMGAFWSEMSSSLPTSTQQDGPTACLGADPTNPTEDQ